MIEHIFSEKCALCGGTKHYEDFFLKIRKDKKRSWSAGDLDRQGTEHTPYKFFRCRSVDSIIAKFTKPLKDNKKRQNTVRFNEKSNLSSHK